MKLLTKYNRINIIATIVALLASGICYYFFIRYQLINQLDKDLKIEELEIIDFVKLNKGLPNPSNYKDQTISFLLLNGEPVKREFSSKDIFSKEENEWVATREIEFPIQVMNKDYKVMISKSQQETDDLIQLILLITSTIVIALLLVLFIINRFLLNKLWLPFNATLQQLKQFNPAGKKELRLEKTGINEFAELNNAVNIMSSRVSRDYDALKNFTENASHEMQTPLAIINSKLDVLIQDEKITEQQMRQLQGIYNALDRLSKLNQSLLLLTKIENNQFKQTENILLHNLIPEKLLQFEEMAIGKNLEVTTALNPAVIHCNKQLADILISNLLNNAIRYNYRNGAVSIKLASNELTISNTSFLPCLDYQKLFQRFYRHTDTRQEGNGLGLSIIKQICDAYNFTISYTFINENHTFQILFQ